jgi:uncharacterized membrane protein (Fun14 family)
MEARGQAWLENPPFPGFAKDMAGLDDNQIKHSTGVKILLSYPLARAPKTVSLRWRRYMVRTTPEGAVSQPPVTLAFFHEDKHRIVDLNPQELALALGGVAAALIVGRALKSNGRAIAALVLCTDLGLAAYAWQAQIAVVTIDSPFQKQLSRPTQAEAQVILRDLLQGVYKAFDFNKDSDIYDALAHCVDGPLLEQIYKDVHGSLVLDDSEGGGAICQVEKVDVTRSELLPEAAGDEADTLRLTCAWTVRGKVSHWGHTHTRANAYEAQYTLAPRQGADGPRWKITGCKVTAQKPVEVDGKQP